ncbi:MAG: HlyC/CorC family transporter [Candidatus Brocadiae bacterium]|nr:HlyC/CorC family transporter [Candidatus Brocadiia bacterium]
MDYLSGTSLTIIAIVSFFCSVFCSLAKSAHVHLSHVKFEQMLETEKVRRRFARYIKRGTQVLVALIILTTIANLAFVISVIFFFSQQGSIKNQDILYALIVSFIPLLVFAKAVPETLARLHAERVMLWVWRLSDFIYWLFCWLVYPLYRLTQMFEKFFKHDPVQASAATIEKEILSVVNEGEKEGLLQEEEKDMITAIIELKDSEVREVMVPRIDMFSIPLEMPINKALAIAVQKGHSRVPVHKENRDDIVGILYIKDLLKYWDDEKRSELTLDKVMRQPYFVPESKQIGNLLKEFQKDKMHMAIAIDEYGGTSGIITVEDILEEIVGEIHDEYDKESQDPMIHKIQENIIEADGRIHVEEINEALEVQIPLDDSYDTIGGFLFTLIGHIPTKGEVYTYKNIQFTILQVSARKLERVKVEKTGENIEE